MLVLLKPLSPSERVFALRKLSGEEGGEEGGVRPLKDKILRSALFLSQGQACLALGHREEAERLLARCVKHTVEESKCNGLTASALPLLAAAIGPLSPEEADAGGGDSGEGEGEAVGEGSGGQSGHALKKRRAEDSLSSGLIIAARMQDGHAKRRALAGFASHYAAVGDAEQAREFSEMLTEFGAQADAERDAAREGGAYTSLVSMAMAPPATQSLR